MKKILIIFMIVISGLIYGQDEQYSYKIKLRGIENSDTAKFPAEYLNLLFKTEPVFNDSLNQFEFISHNCINEHGFDYLMKNEGYYILYFNKEIFIRPKQKNLLCCLAF